MVATTCKTTEQGEAMADMMTVAEAAEALNVTGRRVRAMISAGQLSAVKSGPRVWLIDRASVEAMATADRPRRSGRPRKEQRSSPPLVEIVLDQEAITRAAADAMRGLPLLDPLSGAIVSPQLVAFAAGLTAAKARRGVYRASEGADVSVDGAAIRVRLYSDATRSQPEIEF